MVTKYKCLTKNEQKFNLFSKNQYFKNALNLGNSILGKDLIDCLDKYALVLIKPESFQLNRQYKILELIKNEGYKPVFFKQKKLQRTDCLELWRYQWSAASLSRILISEKLMSFSESFVIIFKAPSYLNEPASTYLSKLKGSADESKRKEYHFRSILQPLNRMLNYIHISDESLDVIREMSILLDWEDQISLFNSLKQDNYRQYEDLLNYLPIKETDKFEPLPDPYDLLRKFGEEIILKADEFKLHNNKTYISTRNIIQEVLNGKAKLDMDFFVNLSTLGLLTWTWEMVVISTTFIEHNSGLKKEIEFNL